MGKPECKRPLARPRSGWKNIEWILRIGGKFVQWIFLAHDREK